MNPFKKIKQVNKEIRDAANHRRKARLKEKSIKKSVKRDEKKMKAQAEEARKILASERWKHFTDFVDSYEHAMDIKKRGLLKNSSGSTGMELIKIESKLGLLDDIRSYPTRCIEEVKSL